MMPAELWIRLDDDGRRRADALAVVEAEADVEAGHVALVATVLDRAAVAVGPRYSEGADARRAVPAAAAIVGARRRAGGDAVPGAGEREHLEAAGLEFRHAQGGFVRFAAGAHEHHLLKLRREDRSELLRQPHHGRRQHAAEQVNHVAATLLDRFRHRRVVVAERRAHLPGAEVEDRAPGVVVDVGASGLRAEIGRERAHIADHVLAHRLLEPAQVAAGLTAHDVTSLTGSGPCWRDGFGARSLSNSKADCCGYHCRT